MSASVLPQRGSRSHYPSWGSGTPDAPLVRRSIAAACDYLITPHGDREPTACKRRSNDRPRSSLPLMGIGNDRGPARHADARARYLITPHGDREPTRRECRCATGTPNVRQLITPHGDRELLQRYRSDVLRRTKAHYPSWGSGTAVTLDPEPGTGQPRLITPHGDREPRHSSTPIIARPTAPHYPSWGSGTSAESTHCAHRSSRILSSLPLMGIGNMMPRHVARLRAPISLPLMGIGNHARELAFVRGEIHCLITPHGDREPGTRPGWPTTMTHYPSWGSGTSTYACSSGPRRRIGSPHYPSWGSGTRSVCHPHAATADSESHYPSWGSGTRIAPMALMDRVPAHYPSWGSGTYSPAIAAALGRALRTHYPSWGSGT